MSPSPKSSTQVRPSKAGRRAIQMSLAAVLLLAAFVTVRISSGDRGTEVQAHGNSTGGESATNRVRTAGNADTGSSHSRKSKKKATEKTGRSERADKGKASKKGKGIGQGNKSGDDVEASKAPKKDPAASPKPSPAPSAPAPTAPAPTAPVPAAPAPAPSRPAPSAPSGGGQGMRVDLSRLPARASGHGGQRIGPATAQPYRSDGVGAFRINCSMSHMNYDDPIVAPGRVGASHLHMFFGNTGVDAYSTSSSIANSGNSTCTGGTANRSAYWTPAMVDTRTNTPVLPWQDSNPWLADNGVQVYYKTGYRGVPSASVQNPPAGLRIVAGQASRTTRGDATNPATPRYWCNTKGAFSPHNSGHDMNRNCRTGDLLVMSVQFPQCWNGRDLDSPDHQSHMAYGTWGPVPGQNGAGCPASHPVPLPEVTINVNYEVPSSGTSTWRLASDMYDGPAGYSGHADWWNGWDRSVFQQVVDNCYRPGLDCQMNLLGNGRALN